MIRMGTYTMPDDKTEEWKKRFLELAANPPTAGIKKWQTFTCADAFEPQQREHSPRVLPAAMLRMPRGYRANLN